MSIIEKHLLGAAASFGLKSAHDMLKKAYREHTRCANAQSDDDRRDAAINGAITLWHMNDWVWNGITESGRNRPELKTLLAVRECPELEICQSICNGSKHGVCRGIAEARVTTAAGQHRGILEIVDHANTVHDAMDVLMKGLMFWHHHAITENLLR
jgi:hypothetical protein